MFFNMKTELHTGEGCVSTYGEKIASFGRKCLIVTGASSAKKCGALDGVTAVLDKYGVEYRLFDRIGPNPLLSSCMEAGREGSDCDFIIGIGGGSPLDAAKAVAVLAANPELDEDGFYAKKWPAKPLPVVLVGTTAGTGSEVTDVSVLTDSKGRKHSIHDPVMYAALSLGDPAYTRTMPLKTTLSTGIDAVAHCVESYFSKKANDISRAASVRGVKQMKDILVSAASGMPLSAGDRETLYNGSVLGGIAISVTGTCFPHNVGYYLTERYGIPHGMACAAFMGDLIDYESELDPGYAYAFFRDADITAEELKNLAGCCSFLSGVKMTADEIRIALPRWENAGTVKNTLGDIDTAFIEKMLNEHFAGN